MRSYVFILYFKKVNMVRLPMLQLSTSDQITQKLPTTGHIWSSTMSKTLTKVWMEIDEDWCRDRSIYLPYFL